MLFNAFHHVCQCVVRCANQISKCKEIKHTIMAAGEQTMDTCFPVIFRYGYT
jgi:hypothetical protein